MTDRSRRRVGRTIRAGSMVTALWLAVGPMGGIAQEPEAPMLTTITGEIVEVMCYRRMADDARGERHAECALKCARDGIDLAVLSADGLYVITGPAGGTAELFALIAAEVVATGVVEAGDDERLSIDVAFTEPDRAADPDAPEADPARSVMLIERVPDQPAPSPAADR